MVKKTNKHSEKSNKDSAIEKEIELERTHPEKIISDELKMDEKIDSEEKENPELQTASMKLVIVTIVVISGLLFGIFLITNYLADSFEPTSYTYNGFSFFRSEDDIWYTSFRIGSTIYPLPFHYGPKDLEDIFVNLNYDDILDSGFIYLAIPPVEVLPGDEGRRIAQAAIEVGKVIGTQNNIFNIPARAVLSSASEYDSETPVVSCANATSDVVVIMFSIEEITTVFEEAPNCFYVWGTSGRDVIRASDRLVYGLLGIM